jgi:CRP-like cAMP-binding protein
MGDNKLDLLKDLALFARCSTEELRFVAATADMVQVAEADVLRRAGVDDHAFYVILRGAAVRGRDAVLAPGDWDGAVGLLSGESDTDELRMLTDGTVLVCGPREFSALMVAVPGFVPEIAKHLSRRLRDQHRRNEKGVAA